MTAPDGVALSVQEAGDPQGQAIVFVHGLLGSHLSWDKQVSSPALQRYRLITFDLRGHGMSGRPQGAQAYRDGRRWADDLAAVLAHAGARRPVLVGWSLGAAVVTLYLVAHGDEAIAAAMYVGGVIELQPDQMVARPSVYAGMASPDLKTYLDAVREFVELCFFTRPDAPALQRLVASAAMASREMRQAIPGMAPDAPKGQGAMRKPLLLLYGEQDALVRARPSFDRTGALHPGAVGKFYPDSGHAPFFEEPERFNRDLAAFAESVSDR